MHVCLIHDVPCKSACILLMHSCLRQQLISGFLMCIYTLHGRKRDRNKTCYPWWCLLHGCKNNPTGVWMTCSLQMQLIARMWGIKGRAWEVMNHRVRPCSAPISSPIENGPINDGYMHWLRQNLRNIVCCIYCTIEFIYYPRDARAETVQASCSNRYV